MCDPLCLRPLAPGSVVPRDIDDIFEYHQGSADSLPQLPYEECSQGMLRMLADQAAQIMCQAGDSKLFLNVFPEQPQLDVQRNMHEDADSAQLEAALQPITMDAHLYDAMRDGMVRFSQPHDGDAGVHWASDMARVPLTNRQLTPLHCSLSTMHTTTKRATHHEPPPLVDSPQYSAEQPFEFPAVRAEASDEPAQFVSASSYLAQTPSEPYLVNNTDECEGMRANPEEETDSLMEWAVLVTLGHADSLHEQDAERARSLMEVLAVSLDLVLTRLAMSQLPVLYSVVFRLMNNEIGAFSLVETGPHLLDPGHCTFTSRRLQHNEGGWVKLDSATSTLMRADDRVMALFRGLQAAHWISACSQTEQLDSNEEVPRELLDRFSEAYATAVHELSAEALAWLDERQQ